MSIRHAVRAALLATIASAFAGSAFADVLLIERAEQAQRAPVPRNGLTMAQVEAQYGAPSERLAPVAGYKPAHPAITRWRYPGFTVYFENQRVISTVLDVPVAMRSGD
jgi:hypothetical protein